MANDETRQQMSEDSELSLAVRDGIQLYPNDVAKGQEIASQMIQKYGIYAHSLMNKALVEPTELNSQLGTNATSSTKTIDLLLGEDISMDKVASVLGVSQDEIQASAEKYTELSQDLSENKTENDNKAPAKNKTALLKACYKDFGRNGCEGKIMTAYVDSCGNPTIGVGHLIFPKSDLNNSRKMSAYRRAYVEAMSASGMSATQAGKDFDAIKSAMKSNTLRANKGCPRIITSPKTAKLTEKSCEALAVKDLERTYNETKEKFPKLDTYPEKVQICMMHVTYAYGNAGVLKNRCKSNDSPENIVKNVAQMRSRGGSTLERDTIKQACDTVGVNYVVAVRGGIKRRSRSR